MMEHMTILLRSIAAFLILLVITRILGKQTLSNMNFHEFVTAVILGAIAANLAFNEKIEVSHLLISFAVFTATSFVLSKLILKSRRLRLWTEGTPTVLVEGGKVLEGNLRKNNLTADTLNQMLRQKDIFDPDEVKYALLENNGQLSVQKKKEHQTTTLKDFNKGKQDERQFPVELIIDGQLLQGNFDANQISQPWFMKQLEHRQTAIEDIFYAVKGSNGQLYIDYYKDQLRHPIDVE